MATINAARQGLPTARGRCVPAWRVRPAGGGEVVRVPSSLGEIQHEVEERARRHRERAAAWRGAPGPRPVRASRTRSASLPHVPRGLGSCVRRHQMSDTAARANQSSFCRRARARGCPHDDQYGRGREAEDGPRSGRGTGRTPTRSPYERRQTTPIRVSDRLASANAATDRRRRASPHIREPVRRAPAQRRVERAIAAIRPSTSSPEAMPMAAADGGSPPRGRRTRALALRCGTLRA